MNPAICTTEESAMLLDNSLIRRYPEFFISEVFNDVLWLRFSGNFFHNITSFDKRDFLGDYFARIKASDQIKTVVFETNYSESGVDEYVHFFLSHTGESSFFSGTRLLEINRLSNIINQMLIDILELNKFTIQLCQGASLNLFLNLGFACDYRIISDDTVFHNAFKKIGGLPIGGGAFFLTKLLGKGKAHQLLLLDDTISAETALALGIADRVTSVDKLEEAALETAGKVGLISPRTLGGVKRLTNFSIKELREYLSRENDELQRVCVQMGHEKKRL